MAGRDDTDITIDTSDTLVFQKFDDDKHAADSDNASFTSFPDPSTDSYDEDADLLTGSKKGPPTFWTFEFYQSLFDVDTKHVVSRIFGSMVPKPGYMQKYVKSRPDLYGPFWICATLVFTIAISGNIADYLRTEGMKKDIWRYDFHKVSFAATAIYSYALMIPLLMWGLLWYRGSKSNYSLMHIICVYGYSLSIYIPLSIFWLIDISWLQWTTVLIGSLLSGSVLLMTFWPTVKDDANKKFGYILLLVIFVLHMLLAVGFMTYFFHGSKPKSDFNTIPVHAVNKIPKAPPAPAKSMTPDPPQIKSKSSDSNVDAQSDSKQFQGKPPENVKIKNLESSPSKENKRSNNKFKVPAKDMASNPKKMNNRPSGLNQQVKVAANVLKNQTNKNIAMPQQKIPRQQLNVQA